MIYKKDLKKMIEELIQRFDTLEMGIMHDDYPKCVAPKDCGFSLCKHGRLTITGTNNADEVTFNNGSFKGKINKKIMKKITR